MLKFQTAFRTENLEKNATMQAAHSPIAMPRPFPLTALAAVLAFALALTVTPLAEAEEESAAAFVAPPFVVGETVVGIDGWEMRHAPDYPIYNDPGAARLIDTPTVAPSQPTTLELKTALKKTAFLKPGVKSVMETRFAVTFDSRYYQGGGLYYQFAAAPERSPLIFGFDMGKAEGEGGLYVQGAGERKIILPRHLMAERSAYTLTLEIDLMSESFSLKAEGIDIAGEPFSYDSGVLNFQEGYRYSERALDLYMGNNYPVLIGSYIDYVKITAAP